MSSCGEKMSKLGEKMSDSEIKDLIKELNEKCPADYNVLIANNFNCADKNIVVNYTVNEEIVNLEKADQETIYNVWRMQCIDGATENDKAFIKTLIESGYGMKCVFTGSNSKKKISIDISNEKLKANKPLTQEENIKIIVDVTKTFLPQLLDGINVVNIGVDDKNLVYECEIDDGNFDVSLLENDMYKSSLTNKIKTALINGDTTGNLFKMICLSGRGVNYRYLIKKTGKTVEVNFSNIELKQIAINNNVKLE